MIRNVIFDIGNVLVDFRWRVLMEDLRIAKETQAVFEKTVFGSRWWGELDHGIYEEDESLAHFREDNREHLDEFNLVWDNRDKLVEPYAYAVGWIEQLKASGLKVYLLSNYPRDVFALHTECGCFPFLDKVMAKWSQALSRWSSQTLTSTNISCRSMVWMPASVSLSTTGRRTWMLQGRLG